MTENFIETDPTKVKPCPFCGSVGVEMYDGVTRLWRIITCIECSASLEVRIVSGQDLTFEEIENQTFKRGLEIWNVRIETSNLAVIKILDTLREMAEINAQREHFAEKVNEAFKGEQQ